MGCKAPTADGDTLQKFPHRSTCVHLSFVILVIVMMMLMIILVFVVLLTVVMLKCGLTCVHLSFVIIVIMMLKAMMTREVHVLQKFPHV